MPITLLIILGLIVALMLYLLFAPVVIVVNSEQNIYMARFHMLASAKLLVSSWPWMLELNIIGIKRKVELTPRQKTQEALPAPKEKTKKRTGMKISSRQVKAFFRSFRVKQFTVIVDTGDPALNGRLFPVFFLIGRMIQRPVAISFTGRNTVLLEVQNNLWRISKAFLFNK